MQMQRQHLVCALAHAEVAPLRIPGSDQRRCPTGPLPQESALAPCGLEGGVDAGDNGLYLHTECRVAVVKRVVPLDTVAELHSVLDHTA